MISSGWARTASSLTATMFSAVITDFGRPNLFASATEPVCRNAVTHHLFDLSVVALGNSRCADITLQPFRKYSSIISALCWSVHLSMINSTLKINLQQKNKQLVHCLQHNLNIWQTLYAGNNQLPLTESIKPRWLRWGVIHWWNTSTVIFAAFHSPLLGWALLK